MIVNKKTKPPYMGRAKRSVALMLVFFPKCSNNILKSAKKHFQLEEISFYSVLKKERLICIYRKQHLQRRGAFWVLRGDEV